RDSRDSRNESPETSGLYAAHPAGSEMPVKKEPGCLPLRQSPDASSLFPATIRCLMPAGWPPPQLRPPLQIVSQALQIDTEEQVCRVSCRPYPAREPLSADSDQKDECARR